MIAKREKAIPQGGFFGRAIYASEGVSLLATKYLAEQKLCQARRKPAEALTAYLAYAEVVRAAATTHGAIYSSEGSRLAEIVSG